MCFHAVFRELLEMTLAQREPARRLVLHRRAVLAFRARGDLTAAYRHLAATGEDHRAHELLVDPVIDAVDRGDLAGLRRLARHLPAVQDVDDPRLALDLALVAVYTDGTLVARR